MGEGQGEGELRFPDFRDFRFDFLFVNLNELFIGVNFVIVHQLFYLDNYQDIWGKPYSANIWSVMLSANL
jgi:hypothetical protein